MLEVLFQLFGAVCGQNPDHTWSPGEVLLPCCQRCTGLYVGAGIAALLHFCLHPKLSGRFLEIHGAFLLVMAPFGFHWLAQGPGLRTVTGVLFGFAVVTFLWLPLRWRNAGEMDRLNGNRGSGAGETPALLWGYFVSLGATLMVLPLTAAFGGAIVAYALSGLALGGMLGLVALVLVNLSLGVIGAVRLLGKLAHPGLEA